MISFSKKIVFITGASSGIGLACAKAFAALGANLILSARRKERVDKLSDELKEKYHIDVLSFQLDVRKHADVQDRVSKLPATWQNIEVLINNAGLARGFDKLYEGSVDDWEEMIDTNIKGLLYVSRAIVPGMVARGSGMIINIGSIAGHETYPKGNVYCATKFAVDALTKGLRMDLVDTPLRVCTIDPGLVETEFSLVRYHGDLDRAKKPYENITPLTADDVADCVLFCATRPAHVQIAEIILLANAQASASLVHRK